jgi:hypothetical protein
LKGGNAVQIRAFTKLFLISQERIERAGGEQEGRKCYETDLAREN